MTALSPYPEYKDSGIEWLGAIPSEWSVDKVGRISPITVGWTPPTQNDASFEGDNRWANISDLGARVLEHTAKRISDDAISASRIRQSPKGSLLYSFKLSVGLVSFAGADIYTNEAIATFLGSTRLDLRYGYYTLPVYLIENASENIYGAKILNQERILSTRIALPPVPMQTAIADFLDRETAEIDAFIADQEELIGLLGERRAATISHAVTKGLDPSVPMKDSDVEWLGMVPEHWDVTRLSRLFDVTLGKMLDAGRMAPSGAAALPYIRAANIQDTGLDLASVNEMPFSAVEVSTYDLRCDDLLVVEGGAIGVNAHLDADMPGWGFQKSVTRVRPRSLRGNTRCLGFALDTLRWSGVIDMLANKSTIAHFTAEKLERLILAFPPADEQAAIVDVLVAETAELDAAIADAREAIALSKERRAALISAAVTGKIDVRGVV